MSSSVAMLGLAPCFRIALELSIPAFIIIDRIIVDGLWITFMLLVLFRQKRLLTYILKKGFE